MKSNSIMKACSGILFLSMVFTLVLHFSECITTGVVPSFIPQKLPVSKVAVVQAETEKAEDIEYPEILNLVKEAVSLAGGLEKLISEGDTVVLKPNLVTINDFTLPGWKGRPLNPNVNGTTTDWRVTKAVVELVRELNLSGKVYVMEGSSVPTKRAFLHHKYTHDTIPGVDEFLAIEEDSGNFMDKDSPCLVEVSFPGALLNQTYYFNKKYYEADVLISLPCLKNHWHAVISGAIKNLSIGATPANIYGIAQGNPGRNSMVNHLSDDLHLWLHDFYMARPPDFVVMDGLQGIQNGPTPSYEVSGSSNIKNNQMNMRLIVAGTDGVAVDTIESLLMGWDPRAVTYLRLLNIDKVGNLDTAAINVVGKSVDKVRKEFKGRVLNPACKGSVIEDKKAPEITITSAWLDKNILRISLEPDDDLHFVKCLLDEKPVDRIITGDFARISINLDDSLTKSTELTLEAYDMYLNVYRQVIKLPFLSQGTTTAKKAAIKPIIDGSGEDECWETALWFPVNELWMGVNPEPEDFSGRFKLSWTEEKLYILAEITDDILRDIHSDPLIDYYKDDCFEVFIDEDASGGTHTYNYNAFVYHISLTHDAVDLGTDSQPHLYNDHIEIARQDNGNVSTWEIALTVYDDSYDDSYHKNKENVPVTLEPGKQMGFALAYSDNDLIEDRESFIGSVFIKGGNKNLAWMDASVFGLLSLLE